MTKKGIFVHDEKTNHLSVVACRDVVVGFRSDELWRRFKTLMGQEQSLRQRYNQVLPDYKATAKAVIDQIFRSIP